MSQLLIFIYLGVCMGHHGVMSFEVIQNRGIFTLLNRHDAKFLTAINLRSAPTPPIVTDDWREASTQKWRAVKAFTVTAYQFKPTSDEDRVMNLDPLSKSLASQTDGGFGLSSGQYWQIKNAGQGFSQIINYQTFQCLQSNGVGHQVGLESCNNSFRQQWKFVNI